LVDREILFGLPLPKIIGSFDPPWLDQELVVLQGPMWLLSPRIFWDHMSYRGIKFCWACSSQLLSHPPKVVIISLRLGRENSAEYNFASLQDILANRFEHLQGKRENVILMMHEPDTKRQRIANVGVRVKNKNKKTVLNL